MGHALPGVPPPAQGFRSRGQGIDPTDRGGGPRLSHARVGGLVLGVVIERACRGSVLCVGVAAAPERDGGNDRVQRVFRGARVGARRGDVQDGHVLPARSSPERQDAAPHPLHRGRRDAPDGVGLGAPIVVARGACVRDEHVGEADGAGHHEGVALAGLGAHPHSQIQDLIEGNEAPDLLSSAIHRRRDRARGARAPTAGSGPEGMEHVVGRHVEHRHHGLQRRVGGGVAVIVGVAQTQPHVRAVGGVGRARRVPRTVRHQVVFQAPACRRGTDRGRKGRRRDGLVGQGGLGEDPRARLVEDLPLAGAGGDPHGSARVVDDRFGAGRIRENHLARLLDGLIGLRRETGRREAVGRQRAPQARAELVLQVREGRLGGGDSQGRIECADGGYGRIDGGHGRPQPGAVAALAEPRRVEVVRHGGGEDAVAARRVDLPLDLARQRVERADSRIRRAVVAAGLRSGVVVARSLEHQVQQPLAGVPPYEGGSAIVRDRANVALEVRQGERGVEERGDDAAIARPRIVRIVGACRGDLLRELEHVLDQTGLGRELAARGALLDDALENVRQGRFVGRDEGVDARRALLGVAALGVDLRVALRPPRAVVRHGGPAGLRRDLAEAAAAPGDPVEAVDLGAVSEADDVRADAGRRLVHVDPRVELLGLVGRGLGRVCRRSRRRCRRRPSRR